MWFHNLLARFGFKTKRYRQAVLAKFAASVNESINKHPGRDWFKIDSEEAERMRQAERAEIIQVEQSKPFGMKVPPYNPNELTMPKPFGLYPKNKTVEKLREQARETVRREESTDTDEFTEAVIAGALLGLGGSSGSSTDSASSSSDSSWEGGGGSFSGGGASGSWDSGSSDSGSSDSGSSSNE